MAHSSSSPVLFIRGLSTNGSDDAYWSLFNVGPMARQFAAAFEKRGIEFHAINGMGMGTLLELALKVRGLLEEHPVWRDPERPVHLFGHSAGGLVARLVAAQPDVPPGKIKSLITVATPNQGSRFAAHCLAIPETFPYSARVLRLSNYDIQARADFLRDLLPENVTALMRERGQVPRDIKQASVVCWAPRAEWCWPLRLFYAVPCFNAFTPPSDGLVERESQPFGEVIAEIHIDHFRQIGIFGSPERFAKLCDTLAEFFKRGQ